MQHFFQASQLKLTAFGEWGGKTSTKIPIWKGWYLENSQGKKSTTFKTKIPLLSHFFFFSIPGWVFFSIPKSWRFTFYPGKAYAKPTGFSHTLGLGQWKKTSQVLRECCLFTLWKLAESGGMTTSLRSLPSLPGDSIGCFWNLFSPCHWIKRFFGHDEKPIGRRSHRTLVKRMLLNYHVYIYSIPTYIIPKIPL